MLASMLRPVFRDIFSFVDPAMFALYREIRSEVTRASGGWETLPVSVRRRNAHALHAKLTKHILEFTHIAEFAVRQPTKEQNIAV